MQVYTRQVYESAGWSILALRDFFRLNLFRIWNLVLQKWKWLVKISQCEDTSPSAFINMSCVYLHTCILSYSHTLILAYLYTCILGYLHTCILAYLYNCILADLYTSIWGCKYQVARNCYIETFCVTYMVSYTHVRFIEELALLKN